MGRRLIDADKLKAHYSWWKGGTREMTMDEAKSDFDTIIDLQPTVELKHGRWNRERLPSTNGGSYEVFRCNLCNEAFNWRTAYCPNCGARMDAKIGEDKSHPFVESVMMGMDGEEND